MQRSFVPLWVTLAWCGHPMCSAGLLWMSLILIMTLPCIWEMPCLYQVNIQLSSQNLFRMLRCDVLVWSVYSKVVIRAFIESCMKALFIDLYLYFYMYFTANRDNWLNVFEWNKLFSWHLSRSFSLALWFFKAPSLNKWAWMSTTTSHYYHSYWLIDCVVCVFIQPRKCKIINYYGPISNYRERQNFFLHSCTLKTFKFV